MTTNLEDALKNGKKVEISVSYFTRTKRYVAIMDDSVLGYPCSVRGFIEGYYTSIEAFDSVEAMLEYMETVSPLDTWEIA
jgi:hypothetical protein